MYLRALSTETWFFLGELFQDLTLSFWSFEEEFLHAAFMEAIRPRRSALPASSYGKIVLSCHYCKKQVIPSLHFWSYLGSHQFLDRGAYMLSKFGSSNQVP